MLRVFADRHSRAHPPGARLFDRIRMNTSLYRQRTFSLLILVLAMALTGAWMLVKQDDSQGDRSDVYPSEDTKNVWIQLAHEAAHDSLANDQALESWPFTGLHAKEQAMPLKMRDEARGTLGRDQNSLGLKYNHVQYARTDIGVGIWVVNGNGVTCIFQDKSGAATCSTNVNFVQQGGLLVVGNANRSSQTSFFRRPTQFLAIGIAPDSIKAVRLRVLGHKAREVPVVGNTYGLRAQAPINFEGWIS